MKSKAILILAAASLVTAPLSAQPQYSQGNRPVMLSAEGGLDPCSLAKIGDMGPEEAVQVYPGDSTDLEAADNLIGGTSVWVCDSNEDRSMSGIVYAMDGATDCEVSSPVADDRAYLGPCSWGWVKAEWIESVAG